MSSIDNALVKVYENLLTKPDWIALISGDGLLIASYNCNLDSDIISGMLVSLHNCHRSVLHYSGSKHRELNFAVGGNEDSLIIIFVIGEARHIFGMKYSQQLSFSALSILEKSLPKALLPLREVFELD